MRNLKRDKQLQRSFGIIAVVVFMAALTAFLAVGSIQASPSVSGSCGVYEICK